MKEKISELLNDKIASMHLFVYDAFIETEDNTKYLRIVLDSEDIIDLNLIVDATNIINPIIDKEDIVDGEYILDIYSREKGEE